MNFQEAWANKKVDKIHDKSVEFEIYYIGLTELIKNKKLLNRHRVEDDLIFRKGIQKQLTKKRTDNSKNK